MKRLIAALLVTATAAALFVLSGCGGEENLRGSDLKASAMHAEGLVNKIQKENIYSKSDLSELENNCDKLNQEVQDILNEANKNQIYEYNLMEIGTIPYYIYRTENKKKYSIDTLKALFEDCDSKTDYLPIIANADYIYWTNRACNEGMVLTKGDSNYRDYRRCEVMLDNLLSNI